MRPRLQMVLTEGPENAPPLVIAHGLFGAARNWGGVARRVAAGRRVIAVDLRNHGSSFHSDDHAYPELAADLAQTIQDLGGQADVLGHSMGGKAAMILALNHPGLVRKLVVADIAPVRYAHSHQANIAAMRSVNLARVTRRSEAEEQLSKHVGDPALRAFYLQSLKLAPAGASWALNLDALERNGETIAGFPQVTGQFTGPVLFLRGELSEFVLPEHSGIIRSLFPAAEFQTISSAGHWLHAEKPTEFATAVAAFLDK